MLLRPDLDARDVGQLEEDQPLGVELTREDGVEVELDIGRADESGGVAEQSQAMAVGQDRPEMVLRAVEQLLDHGLGSSGCSGDTWVALVQVDSRAEQVDRDVLPEMGHRVCRAIDDDAVRVRGDLAIAQLAKKREQPAVPGRAGAGSVHAPRLGLLPRGPRTAEVRPGPGGGVTDRLGADEVVGRW